ncbi:MAG: chemotaxis response regulator protein-glutamate methylesterase [Actinobacteria bacterium]|nr:MAG: chemotaxis response regulator protein-glutamate methylesterase [Actinomycetota bacterium]
MPSPHTIRVLVVDDSALIRQMLTRALAQDPRIEVVGTAKTGTEAIQQAIGLEPDVITLDIEMPELTGLEALPYLIKRTEARVVMLSSLDSTEVTYQALSSGAVDFMTKPKAGFATSLTELTDELLKKIRTASRIDPSKRLCAPDAAGDGQCEEEGTGAGEAAREVKLLVGIAASTGGPPALEHVFAGLSPDLPAAYLIVQHLPQGFTASLAKRIDKASPLTVVEAEKGAALQPGTAYVAPHGKHLFVSRTAGGDLRVSFDEGPSIHGVKPAADPMFHSVAKLMGSESVGVVLTGMGADGAAGLSSVKAAGGETIAQDEATSVVWGMPGAAVRQGAAKHVVPLGGVAAEIRRAIRARG